MNILLWNLCLKGFYDFTSAAWRTLSTICLISSSLKNTPSISKEFLKNIKPLNLGLLLFNDNPDTFFPGCITNLLEFEDEAGTQYSEKRFKGPIHVQIRNI